MIGNGWLRILERVDSYQEIGTQEGFATDSQPKHLDRETAHKGNKRQHETADDNRDANNLKETYLPFDLRIRV
jgi:hypothetical protein